MEGRASRPSSRAGTPGSPLASCGLTEKSGNARNSGCFGFPSVVFDSGLGFGIARRRPGMSGVPRRGGNEVRRRQEHFDRPGQTCGQRPRSSRLQGLPHRHQRVPASRQDSQSAMRHLPCGRSQGVPRQRPLHARRIRVRFVSRQRARAHHGGKSDFLESARSVMRRK